MLQLLFLQSCKMVYNRMNIKEQVSKEKKIRLRESHKYNLLLFKCEEVEQNKKDEK